MGEYLKKMQSLFSVLRLVWDCKPALVVLIFILTIISSLIPFAQTVIAKYVLDSIIAAVGSKGGWPEMRLVILFVGSEFNLVIIGRFLSQYLDLEREILGELFSKTSSARIIEKAVSLDLAHFEDSEYYDKLQKAQRDGNYRPVQLLNQLFTLLENTVSIGSFFTLLLTFKWYFLFLILLAVVPRTWVQFRYANRKYSMINNRTTEQRKVNYFSYLLSNNIFAKEIKLFSLGEFFLNKYRTALDRFYAENRSLAEKRTLANVLTGILAAISSYGAYGIIIYDTVLGSITIGSMTMYYQAFSRSQSSLDTFLKTIAGLYENMLYIRNYLEFMEIRAVIELRSLGVEESRSLGVEEPKECRRGDALHNIRHTTGGSSTGGKAEIPRRGERRSPDALSIEFRNVSFAYPSGAGNGDTRERTNVGIPDRRGVPLGRDCARPPNGNDSNEITNPAPRPYGLIMNSPVSDKQGKACRAHPPNGNDTNGMTNPAAGRYGKTLNFPVSGGGVGAACCAPTETDTSPHLGVKSDYILKNVSFRVDRGQTLAIVGENGAGKSTIVKLLARLYDPDEGSVLLGGKDMRGLSAEYIRKHISVLFQDFNHYQLLVKDNIKVGDISSADGEDRMYSVSRLAGADAFSNSLPEGFDTQLGRWFEKGKELSIGQWQKLALARAFMRDAPILIFDEPTSHLDARAESEIFTAIEEFRKDKIVIVISHRLKTIRRADTIIVLEKGRVRETGNHDALMAAGGLYANLFNLQADGYKDSQPQMDPGEPGQATDERR